MNTSKESGTYWNSFSFYRRGEHGNFDAGKPPPIEAATASFPSCKNIKYFYL